MRLTAILMFFLAGCHPFAEPLTNEQVVAAVKYCNDNGMNAEQWRYFGTDGSTLKVHCVIKKEKP